MSDNTPTLKPSPPPNLQQTASQLTLFAEGSLARTSPSQGGGQEWAKAHAADYGQSTPVLLASYDPATSSWKTSQHFLGEGLTVFSETWPRSGTMQSGIAYRLPALVRLTDETGFGLWRTPQAGDAKACHTGTQNQVMLAHQVMWPTPRAAYSQGSTGGANRSSDLRDFVKMYPTPTVCGKYNRKGASKTSGDGLATAVGGTLNPTWVEWLMGFSLGWTDLNHSETPLYHKSQNSLDEQS